VANSKWGKQRQAGRRRDGGLLGLGTRNRNATRIEKKGKSRGEQVGEDKEDVRREMGRRI